MGIRKGKEPCLGDSLLSHIILRVFDLFCFCPEWQLSPPQPPASLALGLSWFLGARLGFPEGIGSRVRGSLSFQHVLFNWIHTAAISDHGSCCFCGFCLLLFGFIFVSALWLSLPVWLLLLLCCWEAQSWCVPTGTGNILISLWALPLPSTQLRPRDRPGWWEIPGSLSLCRVWELGCCCPVPAVSLQLLQGLFYTGAVWEVPWSNGSCRASAASCLLPQVSLPAFQLAPSEVSCYSCSHYPEGAPGLAAPVGL